VLEAQTKIGSFSSGNRFVPVFNLYIRGDIEVAHGRSDLRERTVGLAARIRIANSDAPCFGFALVANPIESRVTTKSERT